MNYVCGYLFFQLKDGHRFWQINPSQTLMNLQYYMYYMYVYMKN